MGRRTIKRRPGKTAVAGKDFRLAEEIHYIQGRAAEHDGRLVSVGPPSRFSRPKPAMHGCSIRSITSPHG